MEHICTKCEKGFISSLLLQKHILKNTCKEVVCYTCSPCDYTTKIRCNYNKHLKTQKCIKNKKERTKKENYQCEHCYKSFRDNYILSRHLNKKYPCVKNATLSIVNNTNTMTNSNNTITNNNNIIINAHDPAAFLKELNKVDKSIYHSVLGAYSINSPETIKRLNEVAASVPYKIPRLMNPDDYPSDAEDDVLRTNESILKEENSKYLSNVFHKTFFDKDSLEFMPFLRVPNTDRYKVKSDNCLREFDYDIIGSLTQIIDHKMQSIRKEKNISLWSLKKRMDEAYDEMRNDFIKRLKKYRYDNKRIR